MLSDLRVLDLTNERGSLAGKILGDLGADVIKVEPPGGDPTRDRGPHLRDTDRNTSLPWLALNTSKRSIILALKTAEGRARFEALVKTSDVVLESMTPGTLDDLGFSFERLSSLRPGLICCAITPFGQTGPFAKFEANDLVVVAMGGNAFLSGDPDRPPVRCSQPTSVFHAAPTAVLGILAALHARDVGRANTGGQFVDVSMHECQLATLMTGPGQYALNGTLGRRQGARLGKTREIWRTRDGYVTFGLRGGPARIPNLIAMVEVMQRAGQVPDWLLDFDWQGYSPLTSSDEELASLEGAFGDFFATRSMAELYAVALENRILLAPCNDAGEILNQVQLRDRGLFVEIDDPTLGVAVEVPAFFAKSSEFEIGLRRRAPHVGEHTEEVIGDVQRGDEGGDSGADSSSPDPVADGADGIFTGLKILELGAGAAGPVATGYFAEHGAIVIRIESASRPDFLRLLHVTRENQGEPGILDRAPMFALLNPNKQSLTLDLKKPEAVALVMRLVAWADVVSENFAPGVMDRFGLDYGSLRKIREDLIMVSGCLFGQTGPQRAYPGFGGQGAAIAGFNHLTGYPDGAAYGPYGTITDSLAPRYVALSIAAALHARRKTGKGQYIDVSQIECGVYSLAEMIARKSATGETITRCGNREAGVAPHGIYPCRADDRSDDRWIAIATRTDAQWRSLLEVLERQDLADDDRFIDLGSRLDREDELDAALAAVTATWDAGSLMTRLQAEGVEAGVVQNYADLLADPQLAHRDHFVRIPHARLGELALERSGFRIAGAPAGSLESAGPLLGEHNRSILEEVLELSSDEIRELGDNGVLS